MKNKFKSVILFLKSPPVSILFTVYFFTSIFIGGAFSMLAVDYKGTLLEVLAYLLFALAALSLGYSVYTLALYGKRIKKASVNALKKYSFTDKLIQNFGFRTVIFSLGTFLLNTANAIFHGVWALLSMSFWYGTLAVYYILLSFMRAGIIIHHKRRRKNADSMSEYETEYKRTKTYLITGIFVIVLEVAFAAAVSVMIATDRFFAYSGLTIYVSSTYAFYKITMSVINITKAKKQYDLTVVAIRNINFVDAAVSVFALQTALLATFGDENVSNVPYNLATGAAVCLITLAVGVIMITEGVKKLNKLKNTKEKTNV